MGVLGGMTNRVRQAPEEERERRDARGKLVRETLEELARRQVRVALASEEDAGAELVIVEQA